MVIGPDGQPISRGVLNGSATHSYRRLLADWSPGAIGHYLVGLCGVLVSPGRGVLVGVPFLLLLLPGLRAAWRSAPPWARAAAVGGLAYLLIELKVEPFTGGQYFCQLPLPAGTADRRARRCWCCPGRHGRPARRCGGPGSRRSSPSPSPSPMRAVGALCFHGPYPNTPWTFDNFGAALSGTMAPAGYALLVGAALVAARVLRRGYAARRPDVRCGVAGEVARPEVHDDSAARDIDGNHPQSGIGGHASAVAR